MRKNGGVGYGDGGDRSYGGYGGYGSDRSYGCLSRPELGLQDLKLKARL